MMTDKQRELAKQNHNLIYDFIHKRNLDVEEYYGIVAIGLCKAAMNYSSEKSAFSTLAYQCMENEVKGYWALITAEKRIPEEQIVSTEALLGEDRLYYDKYNDNINYSFLLSLLTDRERTIVEYTVNGLTQKQIADKLDITQQSVSLIIKNIRDRLRAFL